MQWPPTRPGPEPQEIPLGAGGLQHLLGVDAEALENDRQLVDQRDVDVALRVLDDLGGFGNLDARRHVRTGRHHGAVEGVDELGRSGVEPEVTFWIVGSRCSLSPGLMRSGL